MKSYMNIPANGYQEGNIDNILYTEYRWIRSNKNKLWLFIFIMWASWFVKMFDCILMILSPNVKSEVVSNHY